MHVRRRASFTFSFAFFLCAWIAGSFGFAQSTAPPGPHMGGVSGEPYSATFITTHQQTLADGTQITQTFKSVRYRDSEGRTRFEDYPSTGANGGEDSQPRIITIVDPVANETIELFPRQKSAYVIAPHFPKAGSAPPVLAGSARALAAMPNVPASPGAHARPKIEDLGYDTIDGFSARGRRITRVIPAGAQGNDQPMAIVSEIWMATDLKIVVRSKMSDPRSGETTMDLQKLSPGEPDTALFQIPPGYTVEQRN